MGNLYCEAQGPCPDPLLCKSDRHNLKVSDQYLKIFSHSSYVYEMLSGGCFVTLTIRPSCPESRLPGHDASAQMNTKILNHQNKTLGFGHF